MADSKYNRTLSKEEIDILREETNNFATNFSKINLTETVKNIITRSYNEANNQNVADDTDLYSIVSNFASDTIDDSIASHALVFGQKLNPENYMESLVSICYTASKKEAEERYERFRLRFEAGDIPDSTEDYNTFMKEVKRTFTGYNLSKKFYKDFKENLNALALEENDIIETVKEAVIENVEETEKKQKLIHDIIEEVNDVKSKYAEKAEPEDSSTTNDEIEAESNSGDNDVNFGEDVDTPPSDLNSENYKKMFGKENAENDTDDSDDETSTESDEPDENDTSDTDDEGLGVAATYQNEDPFGMCSAKFALNIYEEDFNTQGYPTLSKEINSIESALKSIFEDVFKNTYGSKESIKNLNKIKSVEYNKIFNQIKEQIFNKMTTPMKAMENVVIFKEFLENKSYVQSKENFDLSGRRIPLYFPKSEDIMKAISQLAKIERNKLPEAYESFDTLMLTRMDHFFKKGVKNFIFAHDSRESQINLIQLWKFKNGSRVRSEENYRDFYNMMDLSYEDLPSITSVDEIDDINDSKPDNVTDVDTKPLDESAMNEVDTLFKTNPDDKYGDVKIVNPNRGSENDEGNEDDTSEEAISLRLDEYEKEHLAKIKKEIDRCCDEAPKILRETFDQVFTPKVIGKFNKEIIKRNKNKNDNVKLVEKEDVWNYLKKNTIFVDKATLYGKLEKYKKFYTTSGMLKKMTTSRSDKNQAFEFMIVPSMMNKLRSELAKGGKKLNEKELSENNTPSLLFHFFLGGAIPVLILFFFTYLKGFKNTLRKNLKKKLEGTYINVDDSTNGVWDRTTAGDTKLDNFKSQMWGGGDISYYIILDYKFKGKESFDLFFNNKALESAFIPKSLLKFERTPLITPESLSLIFMRKSVEEYNDLKQMFNEGLEHLETIAKRDNNEMALKKVGAWRENLEKGIELFKMKNSAIARLGLCSYNIIDNKRDDLKTQYVAKNIINRGYLLPYYQQKLPNITTENYENSFENIVDRIFDLSIRKRKWESIYPDAVTAREDMEMREEKLEENLMEYSPDEKNFAKALKDTLVFRDLDKFFTFDSMLLDYKSIFYKYVEQEQIKDIIDGAGFRNQVIKGLESRRGYLDENDIYFVDKYLDGMHIENINMTRYEQFAAKLIRDRRNENLDNNVYTAVFTPRSSESIRNEAKLYLSCELTRRALGLETEKNLRETNLFLNE